MSDWNAAIRAAAEAARVLLNSKTIKALEADGRQVDFSALLRDLAGENKH